MYKGKIKLTFDSTTTDDTSGKPLFFHLKFDLLIEYNDAYSNLNKSTLT